MFGEDYELRLAVRNEDTRCISRLMRKGHIVNALRLMVLVDPRDARDRCAKAIPILEARKDDRLEAFKSILRNAESEIEFWGDQK